MLCVDKASVNNQRIQDFLFRAVATNRLCSGLIRVLRLFSTTPLALQIGKATMADVNTQENDPEQTASAFMIRDEPTDEETSSSVPYYGYRQRSSLSSWARRDSGPYVDEGVSLATLDFSRGRTQQRFEHNNSFPRPRPESRASSASSARSMIDDRLEWAHHDRERSASRAPSLPPSPFCDNSPFHVEYARHSSMAAPPRPTYVCNCCPGTPELFHTAHDLWYVLICLEGSSNTWADRS
jgi:hypothetical protein